MAVTDSKVDVYIEKAGEFARPILIHLRNLVHTACPDVKETIKWGFPHFEYKGMLCHMAAFKKHCSFGFWKAALINESAQFLNSLGLQGIDHFDRISTMQDLPADSVLISYIKEAMRLNEEEIKMPKKKIDTNRLAISIPDAFKKALDADAKAIQVFEKASSSFRKEYIEWIADAKTDLTRDKRIATALEWISEGKGRNWKYER